MNLHLYTLSRRATLTTKTRNALSSMRVMMRQLPTRYFQNSPSIRLIGSNWSPLVSSAKRSAQFPLALRLLDVSDRVPSLVGVVSRG